MKLWALLGFSFCAPTLAEFSAQDLHSIFWIRYKNDSERYQQLLSQKPLSTYMYKSVLHMLKDTNDTQQILSLMPIAEHFEKDPEIQLLFVDSLEKNGKQKEADAMVIKLSQKLNDSQEIAFRAVQAYDRQKEPRNALQVIDNYIQATPGQPNNFLFHFLKAQIYTKLNDITSAIAAVESALAIHAGFDKGWLMLGLLHEQSGNTTDAIRAYKTFTETTDQPSAHIQERLMHLILQENMRYPAHRITPRF